MSLVKESVILLVVAIVLPQAIGRVMQSSREAIETTNQSKGETTKGMPDCEWALPCGWGIYNRYTRDIDYYMKNHDCKCSLPYTCIQDEDDVSIPAYVFKCRIRSANDTKKVFGS